MPFNINFKRKLFLYYFSIFSVLTISFLVFQFNREKQYRIDQLESTLNTVTDLCDNFVAKNNLMKSNNLYLLDSLVNIIPSPNKRITLVDSKGMVLFDSFVKAYDGMENHLMRPEIQKAKFSDENKGSNIRHSATTKQDFYYFAHNYGDYFVRAAVVYDIKVKNFLKAERVFLIFIAFIFIITWLILSYVTNKMSVSVTKLKDFAIGLRQNKPLAKDYEFPENELGVIGKQIVSMYQKLAETKNALSLEKEKLIKHLFVLNEGVAFFSPDKTALLTNTHFVQYLNLIAEKSSIHPEHIFDMGDMKKLQKFLHLNIDNTETEINPNNLPQIEFVLFKSGYYFNVKGIVFQDKSFEVLINDITKLEKRKLLKQQMTSNIAHELKTPVASVRGYLETILNNDDMEEDNKNYFINKAYKQSHRLTDLIDDIVVLNKIEEGGEHFEFESLSAVALIDEVIDSEVDLIKNQHASIKYKVDSHVEILGNKSLVISIFQNLIDNSLKYAGEKVEINIEMYHQDDRFYYFSLSDNGDGIQEEHLLRIFERFYRVDAGRSRKMGGTGLGLAIVKHAVNIHKGEVSAKNGANGGAEFYFSLPKYTE